MGFLSSALKKMDKKGILEDTVPLIGYPTQLYPLDYRNGYQVNVHDEEGKITDRWANVGLFGDYREPESDEVDRVTLFKDKRKLRNKEYLDELKPEDYVEYEIKQQPEENHALRNFLGGAAAVTAAVTGAARYTNTGRKLVNDVLKATTEDKTGFDALSTSEKLYTTTANRFGFLDKQLKDADVKAEDINAFYRDKNTYTQNAWHTGSIGDVIQLDVVPETIRTKMATLRDTNQPVYDELEDYLELARQIQHENLSFNAGKDDTLSTMDMINPQPDQKIVLTDYN